MDYQTIAISRVNRVDWVTLNRPHALNSLNSVMIDELGDYFLRLATDEEVRIVVLQGAGRGFCAGLDLADAVPKDGLDLDFAYARQRRIAEIVVRMRRCPQPIISLVHGAACGGGFAFALASDIRIAGVSARMNAAFIRLGLSGCDIGVSYMLPRLVGASLASELLLTGNFIEAERALKSGLVSQVVPDEMLADAARELIEPMLRTTPMGLRLTKECLRANIDAQSLEAAMAMEDRNQMLCIMGPHFEEAVTAFMEKRVPAYAVDGDAAVTS